MLTPREESPLLEALRSFTMPGELLQPACAAVGVKGDDDDLLL